MEKEESQKYRKIHTTKKEKPRTTPLGREREGEACGEGTTPRRHEGMGRKDMNILD